MMRVICMAIRCRIYTRKEARLTAQAVHLFVFDTLSEWDPGYAIAGINNPRFQREPGRYAIRTVSLRGQTVTTAGGLKLHPDLPLEAVSPAKSAVFILPGGEAWDRGEHGELVPYEDRLDV